jgi:hypothetical protein
MIAMISCVSVSSYEPCSQEGKCYFRRVFLNEGVVVKEGSKIDVFANVELLDNNNTPVPSVIRFEKMIYDKTGIDLGYLKDMNSLVRKIKEVKDELREVGTKYD